MSDRYAVVNKIDKVIENIIVWDGVSTYDPGEEFEIMLESAAIEQGLLRRSIENEQGE